jgi:uncharacterized protein
MFVNVKMHFRECVTPVNLNFQWYGGEPLLISPDFYREVFNLQYCVFDGSGHAITNAVQSNFTIIDDDRIELLRSHFDYVGVSLDLFSGLRVNANGVDQENRALANLDRVRATGIAVSGITVLTKSNVSRVSDIYRFYRDRRMNFRVLPLERGLYAPRQGFEVAPRETLLALCALSELWLSDEDPVPIEPLARYLFLVRHMLGHPANRVAVYDREKWTPVLMVSTDGTVRGYGDRFEGPIGNIFDSSLSEIYSGSRFRTTAQAARNRIQKTCTDCSYLGRACPGDPIAESQQDFVELDESGSMRCVVARGLISYLEDRLRRNRAWVDGPIGNEMLCTHTRVIPVT